MASNEVGCFPKWAKKFEEISGPAELLEQIEFIVRERPQFAISVLSYFALLHFGYDDLKQMPTVESYQYRVARSWIANMYGWPYLWMSPTTYNRKNPLKIKIGKDGVEYSIGGFPRDPRLNTPMASTDDEVPDFEMHEEVCQTAYESAEFMEEHKLFFELAKEYVDSIDPSFCDEDWEQIRRMMEGPNNA